MLRAWARFDHPTVELWTGPVDVVHGTNFVVPPSRKAARLVTVHDLTPLRFPELCTPTSLQYPGLIRRALAQGASVHTVSQAMADEVMDHFRVGADRVHVIHNGLAPLRPPQPRDESEAPYILAIGTVEPRKGIPDLVAAFDRVAESDPDVQLTIAGPAGWGEDALAAGISRARHAGRIHRIGWVDDRSSLIAGARVLAYPSLYEGFGLPPLEAMSLGVPVVATTAGAIPEVVGDAAVLVEPRDVPASGRGPPGGAPGLDDPRSVGRRRQAAGRAVHLDASGRTAGAALSHARRDSPLKNSRLRRVRVNIDACRPEEWILRPR